MKTSPESVSQPRVAPRILMVRTGAIGDTLMATPAIRAVRRSFPGAHIVFLCSRAAYLTLRYNPHLDKIFQLGHWRLPGWASPEKRRVSRALGKELFDSVIAFESDARFLPLIRAAKARKTIAYGALAEAGGFMRAPFDPKMHMIDNHLAAARCLGVEAAGREMELGYPEEMNAALRQSLLETGVPAQGLLVGLHAGWGGRKHPLTETRWKSWPPERFAAIARWLANEQGATVILTGSQADQRLNALIAKLSGVRCLNLAGRLSLLDMTALLRRLNAFLTVDSGPAHMAAALGTPLVTLIGPAIIEQTAPAGNPELSRILYHRVHCAPCYGTPRMKSCRDNICMKAISVDEARRALEDLLKLR